MKEVISELILAQLLLPGMCTQLLFVLSGRRTWP